MPEVRGGGREGHAVTAQERPRGATPHLRSGAVAERSNPMSKERWLCGSRRAERTRSGEAAVRRYPSSKVRSSGCALLEQP